MAATAVYVNIARVPLDSRAGDDVRYTNISATTVAFKLKGGLYMVKVNASNYGTVTLQVLGPNGTTWLNALDAVSEDGTAAGYLAPDDYRIAIA